MIIYTLFNFFIRYAERISNGPPPALIQNMRGEILMLLVLLQVVFLLVTFLMSIFMSHRIAGPIFKLTQFFEKARAGDLHTELFFREKDHFQELAGQYNAMIQGIKSHYESQASSVTQAIEDIEKLLPAVSPEARPVVENALSSLRALKH
jgi:nitrogen fixation/metabolism regulation signal transduction histidine kinase